MRKTRLFAAGLFTALLLATAACSIEIYEPDYHSRDTYRYHSDHGRNQCSSCHSTVIRVRIGDPGCWDCH